jgi:hypothetical protein
MRGVKPAADVEKVTLHQQNNIAALETTGQ